MTNKKPWHKKRIPNRPPCRACDAMGWVLTADLKYARCVNCRGTGRDKKRKLNPDAMEKYNALMDKIKNLQMLGKHKEAKNARYEIYAIYKEQHSDNNRT